jgi:tetratricopeptide (TPR) repeat protein
MGANRALLLILLLVGARAGAAEGEREIARLHFLLGTEHYDRGEYAKALAEFEAARKAQALPELDFNMGRCLEKLGRKADAIAAYERFLSAKQDQEVAERVRVLRAEVPRDPTGTVVVTPPPARSKVRAFAAPIALGALTFASVVTGAALLGTTASDYDRVSTTCPAPCPASEWSHLETRANAGYAMLSIAGAAAVVDIALWIHYAHKRRASRLRAEAR